MKWHLVLIIVISSIVSIHYIDGSSFPVLSAIPPSCRWQCSYPRSCVDHAYLTCWPLGMSRICFLLCPLCTSLCVDGLIWRQNPWKLISWIASEYKFHALKEYQLLLQSSRATWYSYQQWVLLFVLDPSYKPTGASLEAVRLPHCAFKEMPPQVLPCLGHLHTSLIRSLLKSFTLYSFSWVLHILKNVFGYKSLIKYTICKYLLPVCSFYFHSPTV